MSTISRRETSGVTLIHVTSLHKISNTEAEELLSSFLDNIEQQKNVPDASTSASSGYSRANGATGSVASLSNAVVQQLQRIRRDLLGLPPLLRKRKADALEGERYVADVEMSDADVAPAQSNAGDSAMSESVDKKERKRLKKERRKEEKRQKEAANSR
ncbi:hypothetical protein V1525DRAFT_403202 [Lipomyces kononenkoae]|uniref:Uncharacterized protein n=1 Tax=Lipomyces kononenkoae TaxID=34357 RepID=A0ACC3T1I8_LIPKO